MSRDAAKGQSWGAPPSLSHTHTPAQRGQLSTPPPAASRDNKINKPLSLPSRETHPAPQVSQNTLWKNPSFCPHHPECVHWTPGPWGHPSPIPTHPPLGRGWGSPPGGMDTPEIEYPSGGVRPGRTPFSLNISNGFQWGAGPQAGVGGCAEGGCGVGTLWFVIYGSSYFIPNQRELWGAGPSTGRGTLALCPRHPPQNTGHWCGWGGNGNAAPPAPV